MKLISRLFLMTSSCILLCGCAHTVTLSSRQSGERATATITTAGNKSGDMEIIVKGKKYSGSWVYMLQGGGVGSSSFTMVSGTRVATGSGSFLSLPMGGPGSLIASAADGSTLRCSFQYSEWGANGLGLCADSLGDTYDMQIR